MANEGTITLPAPLVQRLANHIGSRFSDDISAAALLLDLQRAVIESASPAEDKDVKKDN